MPVDLRLEADITKKAESTIEQNDIACRCSNEGYRSQVIYKNHEKVGSEEIMLMVCVCVWWTSRTMPKKNIFVVVVSTKTSYWIGTFAPIKQKKWNKGTISPHHFFPRYYGEIDS